MDVNRTLRLQGYLIDQLASRGLNAGQALGVAKMVDEALPEGLIPRMRFLNVQWALEEYLPKGMLDVLSTAFVVIFILDREIAYMRSKEQPKGKW